MNQVFDRHPNVNVVQMMQNERLDFEPDKKRLVEKEHRYGRPPQEVSLLVFIIWVGILKEILFSFCSTFRKPSQTKVRNNYIKRLHDMNSNHNDPHYRALADDLGREFKFIINN